MVSVVPIDVSQYAEDIAKNAVSHLSSNTPSTREHAQQLFKALAKQSSDLRPVEQLSKLLFTALKSTRLSGICVKCLYLLSLSPSLPLSPSLSPLSLPVGSPSGKLTVADHRFSVLSAIESLSLCPLSSSSRRQLANSVVEGLVTHIKQEGTIVLYYIL